VHVSWGALPPSTAGTGKLGSFGSLDAVPPEPVAAPPELAVPPPLLPPEHAPLTVGMHVNPSPQSASTLQGSCDLYAQVEIDLGEHVVDGTGSHFVPAAHASEVPPHSSVDV
jgi:hypothetical protein